jgi:Mn2+/Fe2+ NRAMP family transporter
VAERTKGAKLEWVFGLGPGLVFALAGLGPRDMVSNSIAGSVAGAGLLWVIAISLIARGVLLDAMARCVMVTGESLMQSVGRIGKWAALAWFGATILRQHARALIRLMLMGTAAHLVLPLPTEHSVKIWGYASWTLAGALMYLGRYPAVERVFKPIALAMGVCMISAAFLSRPDLGDLAWTAIHPVLPPETGVFSPVVVLMVMISGAVGGGSNVKYPAYVHEKGWRNIGFFSTQRRDLIGSMVGLFIVLSLIQIAAAGTLRPQGIQVEKLDDLIPIFSQSMGGAGRILFGITLWCMAFTQHTGSGAAYGILTSDVFHRYIRPSEKVTSGRVSPGEMPAYRWLVTYLSLSPIYVFFTGWTAIGVVLAGGLLSIVTLPVLTAIVFKLTTDRKVMGQYVNGWVSNLILVLTFLSSLYFSWEGAIELMADLQKG